MGNKSVNKNVTRRQSCGDGEKVSGCQRLGEGRVNLQSTEGFQGSETTVFDAVIVDPCQCVFVWTLRMYGPIAVPTVNCGI